MKVIFLQDVPNVAQAGQIKEVADGYARNYLIPRNLAALAQPQAVSQIEIKTKSILYFLGMKLSAMRLKNFMSPIESQRFFKTYNDTAGHFFGECV